MQHIQSTSDALLKPVKIAGGIVERRQTLPILGNLLIEHDETSVTFTATDLDIQIRTTAPLGVPGEKSRFTVSAGKLSDILSALPATATVSINTNAKKATLATERGQFQMQTLPPEDFPVLPEGEFSDELEIPAKNLRYILNMVQFAMASQDVRFYLNGLLLVAEENYLRAVATDTHRLACCQTDIDGTPRGTPIEAILPRKSVQHIIRILPDDDTPIKVQFSKTQVRFSWDGTEFVSKLIEGKFPDYKRVIPSLEQNIFNVTLNREQLIGALRRVAIMTNEKFHGVRWLLSQGSLHLQSANTDQEEASEDIPVTWAFDDLDMGFNILYLLDALNNLKSQEVTMHFANASSSALLTLPDSQAFRYVLMPMRI